MNSDIRLKLSFQTHPKTKKLKLKLGNDGVISFIYLLMFAAGSKSNGILDGMDNDDIALASDYQGDADQFVETLLAIRYLVEEDGVLKIHDWQDHNSYAAKSEERTEQARKAAEKRWNMKRGLNKDQDDPGTKKQQLNKKKDADSMNQQCGQDETAMQDAQISNAPVPSPDPVPVPVPVPLPSPEPDADIPLDFESSDQPPPKAAAAGFQVEREKRDYSTWVPDRTSIETAKHRCPGITKEFVQDQLDEFRIYASDNLYRPNQMNTRFYKQLVRQWKKREIHKSVEKTRSTFTIPKDTNQIMQWASENGYPVPWPGEETPQYKIRLERLLEERSREITH